MSELTLRRTGAGGIDLSKATDLSGQQISVSNYGNATRTIDPDSIYVIASLYSDSPGAIISNGKIIYYKSSSVATISLSGTTLTFSVVASGTIFYMNKVAV